MAGKKITEQKIEKAKMKEEVENMKQETERQQRQEYEIEMKKMEDEALLQNERLKQREAESARIENVSLPPVDKEKDMMKKLEETTKHKINIDERAKRRAAEKARLMAERQRFAHIAQEMKNIDSVSVGTGLPVPSRKNTSPIYNLKSPVPGTTPVSVAAPVH